MKSWAERLREEGAVRARREVAALLLRERFGGVPADLEERLSGLDSATLDSVLVRLIHVSSVEEFKAAIQEARRRRDRMQTRSGPRAAGQEGAPRVDTGGATRILVEAIDQRTPWGGLLAEASRRPR